MFASIKTIPPLPQKPVKESVQNTNRDAFESGYRVSLGELAVFDSTDQTPNDQLREQRKSINWYRIFLARFNMFSLDQFQNIKVVFHLLVIPWGMFGTVQYCFAMLADQGEKRCDGLKGKG